MESEATRTGEGIVGLGDVEVRCVDNQPGLMRIRMRRTTPRLPCGSCGGPLCSDGGRPVELVDLPAFGELVRLVRRKRRRRCKNGECPAGACTEQDARIAPPRERLTTRAGRRAIRQVGKGRPFTGIAEELGCGWHTVNLSVRRWGEALLKAGGTRIGRVESLGLDETSGVEEGAVQVQSLGGQHSRHVRGQAARRGPGQDRGWGSETVRGIYRIPDHETAAAAVKQLAEDLQEPGLPSEVNHLGRTLERWQTQIPDWHAARVANAPTEAANNLMKRVKRAAFGFRNFANCRVWALLYAGKPDWSLLDSLALA